MTFREKRRKCLRNFRPMKRLHQVASLHSSGKESYKEFLQPWRLCRSLCVSPWRQSKRIKEANKINQAKGCSGKTKTAITFRQMLHCTSFWRQETVICAHTLWAPSECAQHQLCFSWTSRNAHLPTLEAAGKSPLTSHNRTCFLVVPRWSYTMAPVQGEWKSSRTLPSHL